MRKILTYAAFLTAIILQSGCASIVDGGSDKTVTIMTNPAGAKLTITNKKGEMLISQMTPTIVNLNRGGFFKGEDYTLHLETPGYYPADLHVKSGLNGWYLGNVIFGGVIGLLIVDPGTGAMWTLYPRQISWNMVPNTEPLTTNEIKAAELKLNPAPKEPRPTKHR